MRKMATLVLLLVLSTSACAQKVSATEVITKSPTTLIEKRTSKISMDMDFSSNNSGQDFSFQMKAEGVQDYVSGRGRIVVTLVGQAFSGLGPQETLVDNGFVYTKAPCSSGPLTGKTWIKLDQRQAAGLNPNSPNSNDPTTFLEGLRGAGNVEEVGVEKVRGVSTTHYKLKMDVEKALEQLTPERREQAKGVFGSLGKEIPADVWIDEEGLPRRFSFSLENTTDAPGAFKMKMTVETYDYGTRVEVQIPPDDQVYLVTDPQALATICFPTTPDRG